MRKCKRCPNRPRHPSKAACDNCLTREKKTALEYMLALKFASEVKPNKEVSGDA